MISLFGQSETKIKFQFRNLNRSTTEPLFCQFGDILYMGLVNDPSKFTDALTIRLESSHLLKYTLFPQDNPSEPLYDGVLNSVDSVVYFHLSNQMIPFHIFIGQDLGFLNRSVIEDVDSFASNDIDLEKFLEMSGEEADSQDEEFLNEKSEINVYLVVGGVVFLGLALLVLVVMIIRRGMANPRRFVRLQESELQDFEESKTDMDDNFEISKVKESGEFK